MEPSDMRKIFKPWNIIEGREIVSMPWQEHYGYTWYVNARTIPGDPTSMKTFVISDWRLEER